MAKNTFLIEKPWITEKAARLSESNKYVFIVKKDVTKNEVKKAVAELYKVGVVDVNALRVKSKPKRYRNSVYRKSGFKKVIVTLKSGDKINLSQ